MISFISSNNRFLPPIVLVNEAKILSSIQARKRRQNTLNFFHCIRPIYRISRLYGLTPFSFKFNSNAEVIGYEVKPFDLAWFIISLLIYSLVAYFCFKSITIKNAESSFALVIGNHLIVVVGFLFGAFSIVLDMYNRENLVNIITTFTDFDNKVCRVVVTHDLEMMDSSIRDYHFILDDSNGSDPGL